MGVTRGGSDAITDRDEPSEPCATATSFSRAAETNESTSSMGLITGPEPPIRYREDPDSRGPPSGPGECSGGLSLQAANGSSPPPPAGNRALLERKSKRLQTHN